MWFFKTKTMIYGPLVGKTMFTSRTLQLMARHCLASLQTRKDKTKTQTSILRYKYRGPLVSPSTTKKWVPLIVTIFTAKVF